MYIHYILYFKNDSFLYIENFRVASKEMKMPETSKFLIKNVSITHEDICEYIVYSLI